jgi:hypothetical protein
VLTVVGICLGETSAYRLVLWRRFSPMPALPTDDRDDQRKSGQSRVRYVRAWVSAERWQARGDVLRGLRARFDTTAVGEGP